MWRRNNCSTVSIAAGLAMVTLVAACSGAEEPAADLIDQPAFVPVQVGTMDLRADQRRRTDVINPYMTQVARIVRFEVPGFRCLRAHQFDRTGLPDGATTPGEPAIFDLIYPDPSISTDDVGTLFIPTGNITLMQEVIAMEAFAKGHSIATEYKIGVDGYLFETTTRDAAALAMRQVETLPIVAAAIDQGYAVAVAGNCWGDAGAGVGQAINTPYAGRALGHWFDQQVHATVRKLPHNTDREFAYACGEGAHRLTQQISSARDAFDGVIFDSGVDDLQAYTSASSGGPSILTDAQRKMVETYDRAEALFFSQIFGGTQPPALGRGWSDSTISGWLSLVTTDSAHAVAQQASADLMANSNGGARVLRYQHTTLADDDQRGCGVANYAVADELLTQLYESAVVDTAIPPSNETTSPTDTTAPAEMTDGTSTTAARSLLLDIE